MKLIPAIIIALLALSLSAATAYAQEPTETATVVVEATATPTPTPLPDGRLTWELRTDSKTVCVEVHQTRGPEDVRDFDLCGDDDDKRLTLDAGRYGWKVRAPDGWEMDRVTCHGKDAGEHTNAGDDEATVIIAPGRSFTCVAWLDELPQPTATPTRTAVVAATQAPGLALCESGRVIEVPRIAACPASTPVPTATPNHIVDTNKMVISPPSTGSAGLLD